VAIDQTPSTSSSDSPPIAAIDNEFPAYRAISSTAVLSLILGLGSVFCFTSLWFLVVVATSVFFGLIALRKIRQFPEVLTGAAFARLGIGLAVLFGAVSLTQVATQEIMVRIDASRFAKNYVEVLKNESVNQALWYEQPADYRNDKSPDEVAAEMKKMKSQGAPDPYAEKAAVVLRIKERLKSAGEVLEYSKIESKAIDGLTVYAYALLEIHGPGSKEFPKEQYALLQLVKSLDSGRDDWMVQSISYPYTPQSVLAEVKQHADDGHGH